MQSLLKKLNSLNISIDIKDKQLDIKAPKGALTSELLSEIKGHKKDLIIFLQDYSLPNGRAQIPKAEEKPYYPLSSSQKRLWLLQEFEKENTAYNMPSAYKIDGKLDVVLFEQCLHALINRHEILRTNFILSEETGEPVQFVHSTDNHTFKFQYADATEEVEQEQFVEDTKRRELHYAFDLENEPLIRVTLLKIKSSCYQLLFVLHHIISDGWSSKIILEELISNYQLLLHVKGTSINTPLESQYKDYAEWQQTQLKVDSKSKQYWLSQFEGERPVLDLPTYQARPPIKTYKGACISRLIENGIIRQFEKLCASNGASLFMGFQALIQILLYRYTGEKDITIGSPISGRDLPELQNQIGFYVNTLALRTQLNKDDSFLQTLENIKNTLFNAYEHQDYPFDELIQDLNASADRSRNPLFDVIFSIDIDESLSENELPNLKIEELSFEDKTCKFDIEFLLKKRKNSYTFQVTFNTDLFKSDFIERMISHFEELLTNVLINPNHAIKSLTYISHKQKEELLQTFNNTNAEYPNDKTVVDLFKEQVKLNQENVAVQTEAGSFTYKELDVLSTQLALYLIDIKNVKPGENIGVKLERSEWLMVSFIAILKADTTYVPIDTAYPAERVEFIRNDGNCNLIIDSSVIEAFKSQGVTKHHNLELKPMANEIAYTIYTSGTTGKPKGVKISHQSLVNLCFWHKNEYKVTTESKATLYAGISFDASIWEMIPYLVFGATLYPIERESTRLDIDELCSFLSEHQITHSYIPTAICHELIDKNKELLYTNVLTGGDTLKIKSFPKFKLYNNYGPTENTVVTTSYLVKKEYTDSIPIGKPISNTRVYILDDHLELLPIGVAGKLYISGDGISKGYLNSCALTAEKFIDNPFEEGQRMYNTGDMARWLPDGNIVFLGRKDHQVKMRGYRIELGEIENAILSFNADISQVVVVHKKIEKHETLIAFITSSKDFEEQAIKTYLYSKLPAYTIPDYYIHVDEIPINFNGKTDKQKLLSTPLPVKSSTNYVKAQTDTETHLVGIWKNILNIDKIGIYDNFFELGGHSLQVTRMLYQINDLFNIRLHMNEVFMATNIYKLAKLIDDELIFKAGSSVSLSNSKKTDTWEI